MVFRAAAARSDREIVAINDLLEVDYLAYMLKHDSVHGAFKEDVVVKDRSLMTEMRNLRMQLHRFSQRSA